MYPIALRFGDAVIGTHDLFSVLAIAIGFGLYYRELRRRGWLEPRIVSLASVGFSRWWRSASCSGAAARESPSKRLPRCRMTSVVESGAIFGSARQRDPPNATHGVIRRKVDTATRHW